MSHARVETILSHMSGPGFDRARPTRTRPGVGWIPTSMGDVRIRRFEGEGRPRVVLCTDMPNVIEDYDEVGAQLVTHFDPIVVEPPGTGGSWPAAGFRFTREDLVHAIAQVLEAVGPSHLVMPCYLGHVGLALAAERPTSVLSLVLSQVPTAQGLRRWADRVDPRRLLRTPLLGQLVVRLRRREIARRWYEASSGERRLGPGATAAFDFGGCWCLASLLQRFSPLESPVRLPSSTPTAILWGDADRTHRGYEPQPLVPHAYIERWHGVGHCPELEAPNDFTKWLVAFAKGELRS